jgi:hypothetical protein
MSLHLYSHPIESGGKLHDELRLLCAYENGSVTLRKYERADKSTSVEGVGWGVLWTSKLHAETSTRTLVNFCPQFD